MVTSRKSRKPVRRAPRTAQDRMLGTMRQIWLAGLGALSKARSGAPQLMEELVAEGARIHADTRGAAEKALGGLVGDVKATISSRVAQVRGQAGDAMENLEKIFQTRVHRALTQLGVPSAEDVDKLSTRVEELNTNIGKLARQRKPTGDGRRTRVARKPARAARKVAS